MANPVFMTKLMAVASVGASNIMMPSYCPNVKYMSRMVMFFGGLIRLRYLMASSPFPFGSRRVMNSILMILLAELIVGFGFKAFLKLCFLHAYRGMEFSFIVSCSSTADNEEAKS